ncbi:MAG: MFS transporter [Candidatus Heimdallarchaeota archaeon]
MIHQQKLVLIGVTFAHSLSHAFVMTFPALLPFIQESFVLTSYTELGLLPGILLVTYGLTTFPSGILSDAVGITRVLTVYLVILAICSFMLLVVTTFTVLLVLVGVIGLTAGLYHPPGLSLISQSFSSDDLGKFFGAHGISGNIGVAIAPGIAVFIASTKYGWQYALLPFGLFSLFAIPLFLALPLQPESTSHHQNRSKLINSLDSQFDAENPPVIYIHPLIVIFAISTLVGLIDRGLISFLAVYLVDARYYTHATAGFIISGIFLIAITSQIAFGMFADSIGPMTAFRIAAIVITLFFFLIPFVPGTVLLIVLTIAAFAITGTQPPLNILTTSVSPLEKRGTIFGFQFTAVFGFGGIAGFLAGIIASLFGLEVIYLVLSGFGALLLILLLIYPRWAPTPTY